MDDVNLQIYKGETLGLIGESGCGKSTLSRVLLGLTEATAGEILFKGQPVDVKNMKAFRRQAQMIFQDPYSSLDPRMSVGRIIEEPLRIHTDYSKKEKRDVVKSLLEKVSLPEGGPETDVPAGDIGVGGREVGFMFGMYKKLSHEFTGTFTAVSYTHLSTAYASGYAKATLPSSTTAPSAGVAFFTDGNIPH